MARVPSTTWAAPASNHDSMWCSVRMPPATCTGMCVEAMSPAMRSWFVASLPSAASTSRRCSLSAPCASNLRTASSGVIGWTMFSAAGETRVTTLPSEIWISGKTSMTATTLRYSPYM